MTAPTIADPSSAARAGPERRRASRPSSTWVVVVYVAVAIGWVVLSDAVVRWALPPGAGGALGTAKGVGFVVVTALALWGTLAARDARYDREQRARASAEVATREATDEALGLSAAIEQIDEAVVLTDAAARIVYANAAFERATGYQATELLGRNPRVLKSGHIPTSVYEDLWATLTAGRTWRGELVNRRRDGSLFREAATISPVLGDDGEALGYVAVKRTVGEYAPF